MKPICPIRQKSNLILSGLFFVLGGGMYQIHAQQLSTIRLDEPMTAAAVSPNGRYVAVNTGRSRQNADGSWNSTESIQVMEPDAPKVFHQG